MKSLEKLFLCRIVLAHLILWCNFEPERWTAHEDSIEMRLDDPTFRPPIDRLLMNTEAISHFFLVQHSALTKPIIARTKAVGVHEIGYGLTENRSARPGRADAPG